MDALHHDAQQWPEPDRFEPKRFDTKDPDNKWSKTSDGKPRSPYSFSPFFGGKRICLGKTFAETNIRFTVPLIYHYLNLELEDPSYEKTYYSAGAYQEPIIPMIFTIRNKVI